MSKTEDVYRVTFIPHPHPEEAIKALAEFIYRNHGEKLFALVREMQAAEAELKP